jgi:hypothetical protein
MSTSADCSKIVQEFRASDPKLKELLSDAAVFCRNCTAPEEVGARAYITDLGDIVLCSNKLRTKQHIKEALLHEGTHAFDFTNSRCDFGTCEGLAHSEVRAAREAECSGYYPFQWLRDRCIKEVAVNSTANMFGKAKAVACVDKVFTEAMADTAPTSDTPSGFQQRKT